MILFDKGFSSHQSRRLKSTLLISQLVSEPRLANSVRHALPIMIQAYAGLATIREDFYYRVLRAFITGPQENRLLLGLTNCQLVAIHQRLGRDLMDYVSAQVECILMEWVIARIIH